MICLCAFACTVICFCFVFFMRVCVSVCELLLMLMKVGNWASLSRIIKESLSILDIFLSNYAMLTPVTARHRQYTHGVQPHQENPYG